MVYGNPGSTYAIFGRGMGLNPRPELMPSMSVNHGGRLGRGRNGRARQGRLGRVAGELSGVRHGRLRRAAGVAQRELGGGGGPF